MTFRKYGIEVIEIKNLQELLDESDIKQKNLATELGISKSYCSLLINGKRKMSFDIATLISQSTGNTLEEVWSAYNVCRKSMTNSQTC